MGKANAMAALAEVPGPRSGAGGARLGAGCRVAVGIDSWPVRIVLSTRWFIQPGGSSFGAVSVARGATGTWHAGVIGDGPAVVRGLLGTTFAGGASQPWRPSRRPTRDTTGACLGLFIFMPSRITTPIPATTSGHDIRTATATPACNLKYPFLPQGPQPPKKKPPGPQNPTGTKTPDVIHPQHLPPRTIPCRLTTIAQQSPHPHLHTSCGRACACRGSARTPGLRAAHDGRLPDEAAFGAALIPSGRAGLVSVFLSMVRTGMPGKMGRISGFKGVAPFSRRCAVPAEEVLPRTGELLPFLAPCYSPVPRTSSGS